MHSKRAWSLFCKQTCCFRWAATQKKKKLHKLPNSITVFQWMWPQWANLWPQLFVHRRSVSSTQAAWMTQTLFTWHSIVVSCCECAVVHVFVPTAWPCLATLHCIVFAWTQQWLYSWWNWEDEFGRACWPTAELSLYNPWFVLTNVAMANWITRQMCLLWCPNVLFEQQPWKVFRYTY